MTGLPSMRLWSSRPYPLPRSGDVSCDCHMINIVVHHNIPLQAGLTTTLNSRCSVLAAANSVFGRWDDTKGEAVSFPPHYVKLTCSLSFSLSSLYMRSCVSPYATLSYIPQNIDFMPTSLSRFDMIFIVKDEHDVAKDTVSHMSRLFDIT